MPFLDLPPQMQERVVCSVTAAIKYEVPANLVLAVAEKEGGKPGQRVRNSNGTDDVGAMQFNTAYLRDLSVNTALRLMTLRRWVATPMTWPLGGYVVISAMTLAICGHAQLTTIHARPNTMRRIGPI